jgi:Pectate lyase superfamily protein
MAELWANNASSTLATGITNSDTALTVQTGDGGLFPNPSSPDYFYCTLDDGTNVEIIKVTARSTDNFSTIVRAQQGTSAHAFSASVTKVEVRLTSGTLQNLSSYPYFDARAYGVTADGSTDDTTALGDAITAAAAVSPRGTVVLPHGTIKTTGNYDLTGLDGIQIIGQGTGSTIIRLAHATNDLFKVSAGQLTDAYFGCFSVTSDTVTRTAGWVFHHNVTYNAAGVLLNRVKFQDIDIKKQVNGIFIARYQFVWVNRVFMSDFVGSSGVGLKFGQTTSTDVNQGSEAYVTNSAIFGNDFVGADPLALSYGIWIEDTDAIYMTSVQVGGCLTNCLKVLANAGGHGPSNSFFTNSSFDTTKTGHVADFSGGGTINEFRFTGCWFASAGQISGGSATSNFALHPTTVGRFTITGCTFLNQLNTASSVIMTTTNGLPVAFTGNTITSNGGSSVGLAIYPGAVGNAAPVVIGNSITGNAANLDIFTDANSNLAVVRDNYTPDGVTFGAWPQNLNWSGATTSDSTAVANTTAETAFDKSVTIPAYAVQSAGTIIRIHAHGLWSSTASSPVITLRVYIGGASGKVVNVGVYTVAPATHSNLQWENDPELVVRATGASGTARTASNWRAFGADTTFGQQLLISGAGTVGTLTPIDWTTTQQIVATVTWGTADPSNSAMLDALSVEVIKPS